MRCAHRGPHHWRRLIAWQKAPGAWDRPRRRSSHHSPKSEPPSGTASWPGGTPGATATPNSRKSGSSKRTKAPALPPGPPSPSHGDSSIAPCGRRRAAGTGAAVPARLHHGTYRTAVLRVSRHAGYGWAVRGHTLDGHKGLCYIHHVERGSFSFDLLTTVCYLRCRSRGRTRTGAGGAPPDPAPARACS